MKTSIILILIVSFIGCSNNDIPEYKKALNAYADTTMLFSKNTLDSSDVIYYKRFVRNNMNYFIVNRWSPYKVDSLFTEVMVKAEKFSELQSLFDIEYEYKKGQFGIINYYDIIVTNKSEKVINGLKLKFNYYDAFQESLGEGELSFTSELRPGESYKRRFNAKVYDKSVFEESETVYIVSQVVKVSASNSNDIESKLKAEVQDFENFVFPGYLRIDSNVSFHELNDPN